LLLCLIGVGVSGYLSYTRLFVQSIVCVEGGGCDRVNNSQYALFLGIPVSYMGLGMYLLLTGLVIARWQVARGENAELRNRLDWALFVLSLGSLVFSAYLTAMSFFVIQATCIWCLTSAITITVLCGFLAVRLWRAVGI
jgi:uncharacterized membrane protein